MDENIRDGETVRCGILSNGQTASHHKVLYRCDHRACADGCNRRGGGRCDLTSDPRHARNFELNKYGVYVEKDTETVTYTIYP